MTTGHVLVIGVDGVRFDLLGPDTTPASRDRSGLPAGHGGREAEVTTAWVAAAGPGIRPGAPPLITRQAQVAPLVLAALGRRSGQG
jgi:hypothetical protein